MPVARTKKEVTLFLTSLRPSLKLFQKNDPLRLAGATAFFTTFALPPIIFLLAQLFGVFFGRKNVGRGLITNVSNVLGQEGGEQVRQVIRSILGFSSSWYVIVIGVIFLFFVATTLFNVIKNTLNQIWQIGVKEKPGFLFQLSIRFRSFAVIIVVGILFLADLFFESLEVIAGNYIEEMLQGSGVYFKSVSSEIASILIVSAWFIVLFRFIADGWPTWKAALIGGLLTSILFAIGRLVLTILLVNSNIGLLYGSAGSFVLILLFVFYSSFILYFGACFIAVYSEKKGWSIKPNHQAFAMNDIVE